MIPDIQIDDYSYPLPDDRIAKYPLKERDASKLLMYNKDKSITEHVFSDIPELLPEDSIIVFNDTKVVPARLHFRRQTGARIEIFCLQPAIPEEYNLSFAETASCSWKCVIGNAKKWKGDVLSLDCPEKLSEVQALDLKAELISRNGETGIVKFFWTGGHPFSKVLELCGTIPIPPYLNRESEAIDAERYQTLYAKIRGSVAAPTAGLHFTERELDAIRMKGIDTETICLHVGAGTFLPVKEGNVAKHPMHREPFTVSLKFLKDILHSGKKITAVGTTSVRTLESLYYIGVSCIRSGHPQDVEQWAPYSEKYPYSTDEAIGAIIRYMEDNSMTALTAGTRIIIVPGFRFRLVDALVTNFHQPESTLILLVSAFVGGNWRPIYDYALSHGFRFLSYGDSSLLFRE